jgi:uncharacterized protein YeaO (DUF488 family)
MLRLKRVYETPMKSDGRRILVDRLWPRGLTKRAAQLDEWLKDLAPSADLRRWFAHDPARWPEFRRRYRRELTNHKDLLEMLAGKAVRGRITLVYGARDTAHNDAVVLAAVIRDRIRRKKRAALDRARGGGE